MKSFILFIFAFQAQLLFSNQASTHKNIIFFEKHRISNDTLKIQIDYAKLGQNSIYQNIISKVLYEPGYIPEEMITHITERAIIVLAAAKVRETLVLGDYLFSMITKNFLLSEKINFLEIKCIHIDPPDIIYTLPANAITSLSSDYLATINSKPSQERATTYSAILENNSSIKTIIDPQKANNRKRDSIEIFLSDHPQRKNIQSFELRSDTLVMNFLSSIKMGSSRNYDIVKQTLNSYCGNGAWENFLNKKESEQKTIQRITEHIYKFDEISRLIFSTQLRSLANYVSINYIIPVQNSDFLE